MTRIPEAATVERGSRSKALGRVVAGASPSPATPVHSLSDRTSRADERARFGPQAFTQFCAILCDMIRRDEA